MCVFFLSRLLHLFWVATLLIKPDFFWFWLSTHPPCFIEFAETQLASLILQSSRMHYSQIQEILEIFLQIARCPAFPPSRLLIFGQLFFFSDLEFFVLVFGFGYPTSPVSNNPLACHQVTFYLPNEHYLIPSDATKFTVLFFCYKHRCFSACLTASRLIISIT